MKIIKILILSISLLCINQSIVVAQDCSKLDKLSKEYAECNAKLLKKNGINVVIYIHMGEICLKNLLFI